MQKIRWLSEAANEALAGLSEPEIVNITNLLEQGETISKLAENGRVYIENGCLKWNGKTGQIFFRVKIFDLERIEIPEGIIELDYNVLTIAGNVAARQHGLEIKRGSIWVPDHSVGAADAAAGKSTGYSKSYYYVEFTCLPNQLEVTVIKVPDIIQEIEQVATTVAIQEAKRIALKKKMKIDRVKKLAENELAKNATQPQ